MKKINSFDLNGQIVEEIKLDFFVKKDFFHKQSIFDAVNIEQQNQRHSNAHTKNKSEVSGTGKKPFKQKHTGKARQGSRRNPQFVGGGRAFGPTNERNFKIKMNKKVSSLAFCSAWNNIFQKGLISVLDKDFYKKENKPKTKNFYNFLKNMKLLDKKILLLATYEEENLMLSSQNIPNLIVQTADKVSVRDLLNLEHIIVSHLSLEKVVNSIKKWI